MAATVEESTPPDMATAIVRGVTAVLAWTVSELNNVWVTYPA
jgi:hypothetical protein